MSVEFASAVGHFSGQFTYNSGLTVQTYDSVSDLLGTYNSVCLTSYVGSGSGCAPTKRSSLNTTLNLERWLFSARGSSAWLECCATRSTCNWLAIRLKCREAFPGFFHVTFSAL